MCVFMQTYQRFKGFRSNDARRQHARARAASCAGEPTGSLKMALKDAWRCPKVVDSQLSLVF